MPRIQDHSGLTQPAPWRQGRPRNIKGSNSVSLQRQLLPPGHCYPSPPIDEKTETET